MAANYRGILTLKKSGLNLLRYCFITLTQGANVIKLFHGKLPQLENAIISRVKIPQ
jgi:hypothetical protein